MPAGAPLGEAHLTVTYSGQRSLPQTIQIVEGSFGIFTVTSDGHAPDLGPLAQPVYHTAIPTARSGQVLTIWGTGLGRTREPEVFIGRAKARVKSADAASCCTGVEKIEFELPTPSPVGCAVPVQVRIGGSVSSNVVTIPVSADGGPGSDPGHWLPRVSSAAQRLGLVTLVRADFLEDQKPEAPEAFTYDLGFASFIRQTAEPPGDLGMPSVGGCTTYAAMIPLRQWMAPPLPVKGQEETATLSPLEPTQVRKLDAGAGLWVQGPTGSRPLQPDPRRPRYYSGKFGGSLYPKFYKPGSTRCADREARTSANSPLGFRYQATCAGPIATRSAPSAEPAGYRCAGPRRMTARSWSSWRPEWIGGPAPQPHVCASPPPRRTSSRFRPGSSLHSLNPKSAATSHPALS